MNWPILLHRHICRRSFDHCRFLPWGRRNLNRLSNLFASWTTAKIRKSWCPPWLRRYVKCVGIGTYGALLNAGDSRLRPLQLMRSIPVMYLLNRYLRYLLVEQAYRPHVLTIHRLVISILGILRRWHCQTASQLPTSTLLGITLSSFRSQGCTNLMVRLHCPLSIPIHL